MVEHKKQPVALTAAPLATSAPLSVSLIWPCRLWPN